MEIKSKMKGMLGGGGCINPNLQRTKLGMGVQKSKLLKMSRDTFFVLKF